MTSARLLAGALVLAALGLFVAGVAPAHAQEPENTDVVEGRVVNGTAGATLEPGLVVVLHADAVTPVEVGETIAGPEGLFRFEGIAYDPSARYALSVTYRGVFYGIALDLSDESPSPVELTVYETVDDLSVLSVTSASVLLFQSDAAEQTLWSLEILNIANASDRTYVPGGGPMGLLRFGLPNGAMELSVDTALPGDALQVDLGFALTASVPPGDHQLMYSYMFPYEGTEAALRKSYPYGAGNLRVLTPVDVARLDSDDLGAEEEVTIGERPYHLMTAADLPRGARVTVNIRGLSVPSVRERVSGKAREVPFEYAAAVVLGLAMVFLIGLGVWKRGRELPESIGGEHATGLDVERARLAREMADLEEALESGAISEEQHLRRREELQARLAGFARRMRDR